MNRMLTLVAALTVALVAAAAPAAADPPPEPTHVTVAWLTPDGATPDPHDPNIWPQTYIAHVDTAGADLAALDDLEPPCGRVLQIDVYRYTKASDRAIVDELIAGGILDLVNGRPADHQVVEQWKFVAGPDCDTEPPPTTVPPTTEPPPTTVPPTTEPPPTTPPAEPDLDEVAGITTTPHGPTITPATLPVTGTAIWPLSLAAAAAIAVGTTALVTARRASLR
ncbi:MAG: hypothetical protein ACXIVQ_12115 [Acidimicrobiales bacterium]